MANPASDMNSDTIKSLKQLLAKHVTVNGLDNYDNTKVIIHLRDFIEGTDLQNAATFDYLEFSMGEIIDIDSLGILATHSGGTTIRLIPWSAVSSLYIKSY